MTPSPKTSRHLLKLTMKIVRRRSTARTVSDKTQDVGKVHDILHKCVAAISLLPPKEEELHYRLLKQACNIGLGGPLEMGAVEAAHRTKEAYDALCECFSFSK